MINEEHIFVACPCRTRVNKKPGEKPLGKVIIKSALVFAAVVLSTAALLFAADFASSFTSKSQNGIYTSWNPGWQFPSAGTGTVYFTAQAQNDIHIAISDEAQKKDPMYEIVIGGWGNQKSAIRRKSQGVVLQSSPNAIMENTGTYWVSIDALKSTVSAGYGTEVGKNIIIEWKDPHFLSNSRYFAFSSWSTDIEYSGIALAPARAALKK
jgi:hypothetical protein